MSFLKVMKNDTEADDRLSGDGSPTPVQSQCALCERRDPTGAVKCEAFPHGIPPVIFFDAWNHEVPFDMDGYDDHGLTFVPKGEGKTSMAKIFAS